MSATAESAVRHNAEGARFETMTPDGLAFASYRRTGGIVSILHTEVPPSQQGEGVGGRITAAALDWVRASGEKVMPLCPFAAAYIREHPQYRDLVVPGYVL